jgi:hypothetical protein
MEKFITSKNCSTSKSPSSVCHSFCASLIDEMFHVRYQKNSHFCSNITIKISYYDMNHIN